MSQLQKITRVLPPVYHSNSRTRFRIPSKGQAIASNMRLAGLKVTGVTGGDAQNYYLFDSGCLALINTLVLSNKGDPLDNLTLKASHLATFLNIRENQDTARSVRKFTVKSRMDYDGDYKNQRSPELVEAGAGAGVDSATEARVSLEQLLGLLRAEDYLVGMDDLELTITWKSDPVQVFRKPVTAINDFDVAEPVLIYEEVLDKDEVKEMHKKKLHTQTPFDAYELEQLTVPTKASAANLPQDNKIKSKAFKNKFVKKLAIATVDNLLATPSEYYNVLHSRAQINEKWNLQVNHLQHFRLSVDSNARKVAMLNDSQGEMVIPTGQNVRGYAVTGAGPANIDMGNKSYFGCDINMLVQDMVVEFSREGINTDTTTGGNALNLMAFAKVQKYLKYHSDGSMTLGYLP